MQIKPPDDQLLRPGKRPRQRSFRVSAQWGREHQGGNLSGPAYGKTRTLAKDDAHEPSDQRILDRSR